MKFNERDHLLFHDIDSDSYEQGVRRFQDLDGETLRQLILLGYANPLSNHHGSPQVADFCEFLMDHPNFTCHGYAFIDDPEICIEGIYSGGEFEDADVEDFYMFSEDANDLIDSDVFLYSCWE